MTKIHYEPHPVTPERKAELRAAGYQIIDAVFKPVDADQADERAAPPEANGDGKVTAAELKTALAAAGVAFKSNASKAELQALLDAQ